MDKFTMLDRIPSTKDYNKLTDKVGWGVRQEKIVETALKNSLYCVSVYFSYELIGFGRIIGDKTIFIYIQDIMVMPKYQNKGIGTQIMKKLLEKIDEFKIENPNIRTYLGASKGKEDFYKRFGFKTRKEADLGEGMILF